MAHPEHGAGTHQAEADMPAPKSHSPRKCNGCSQFLRLGDERTCVRCLTRRAQVSGGNSSILLPHVGRAARKPIVIVDRRPGDDPDNDPDIEIRAAHLSSDTSSSHGSVGPVEANPDASEGDEHRATQARHLPPEQRVDLFNRGRTDFVIARPSELHPGSTPAERPPTPRMPTSPADHVASGRTSTVNRIVVALLIVLTGALLGAALPLTLALLGS